MTSTMISLYLLNLATSGPFDDKANSSRLEFLVPQYGKSGPTSWSKIPRRTRHYSHAMTMVDSRLLIFGGHVTMSSI